MRMVDIMYKYVNRFINADDVLKLMDELEGYSKDDKENIENTKLEIKKIIESVPNEEDEVERKRKETINHFLEKIKNAKTDNEKIQAKIDKKKEELQSDLLLVKDGGEKYKQIFNKLTHNEIVNREATAMDAKDLLEFITHYISVPCPPQIDQEAFDEMVEIGIKEDKREALWRLAFNYDFKGMNFNRIVDYFILKRDVYYLMELVCAVQESLDMDYLIDKVIETNDKVFINKIIEDNKNLDRIEDKHLEMLKNA